MRLIAVIMLVGVVATASAQEPAPYRDPYAAPNPAPTYPPPPIVAAPLPPPTTMTMATGPAVHMTLSRGLVRQWRGARVMNGFGGVIGIMSGGLSLTSAIYVAADHYPPSLTAFAMPPKPSDPAQALSYVSSTSAAFAFGLAAGGLAWRHHILRQLGADPGRGLFLSGTVVGLVGLAAIATSYIIGFSNSINAHDQSIAVLATSLGGSAFCNVGSTIYAKDSSKLTKAWKSLTTF